MSLPYDPENPPREPPRNADALMWRLAFQVHGEHRPGAGGGCVAAGCAAQHLPWPCAAARLSAAGFAVAVGSRVPWATLNQGSPPYRGNTPYRTNARPPRSAGRAQPEPDDRSVRQVILDTGMCRMETDPEHGVIIRGEVTTAIVDGESVLVPHR
jgi:hypothetical protein